MLLNQAFHLKKSDKIAFVGAGGKTSAIFSLAKAFGGSVIVTTTTHLGVWQAAIADKHWIVNDLDELKTLPFPSFTGINLITGPSNGDERLHALGEDSLNYLKELADGFNFPMLIEADGARQKPIKAPASYEPVIPGFATHVVVVVGMQAYQKPLTEQWVHRVDEFSRLSGTHKGSIIDLSTIERSLSDKENGYLASIPNCAKRLLLINQADDLILQAAAGKLARNLLNDYANIAVAALGKEPETFACFHKIAGIVLAAGESTRFKGIKQTQAWRDSDFITYIARTAKSADLEPVRVVLGAHREKIVPYLVEEKVDVIENHEWKKGQSTSIKAGLRDLPADIGGVIFLLADQPQISPMLIKTLMETAFKTAKPIIAPLIGGERGNPVYFSADMFDLLKTIEGDQGGRAIFSKVNPFYFDWHDQSMLIDVDTETDLHQLRELE